MENTNQNRITTISIKVQFIGEFTDFKSWEKNNQNCANKFGITSKLLHIDSNGFATGGYNMKNSLRSTVYPVKTYLMVQDDQIVKPSAFRSTSNN
ncbi:hypothetical protein [Flavobacterium sp. T12S277]|uniref:hypothetical protein n=1 Tax=Flavobacterium sp. T12S277 TaxID=3402752 RepID=UPI003ADDC28D